MILSCGEALIDMLPRVTTAGEEAFAPYAGGAVFNTAIALGRLGAQAGFLTGLSSDLMGDVLRRTLAASNVDVSLSVVSDRPTTLAFVKLTDGHATYAFYDENTAGRMLTPTDMPALTADVRALFIGGIWLAVEPCGTALESFLATSAAGRVTMMDPNVRPSFVADPAAYRARIERMFTQADIVKLSDEDAEWLFGAEPREALVERLRGLGVKVVLVTEGAQGATAYAAGTTVTVAAPRVVVADTVGAGDTFNAGFLAALDRNGHLAKAAVADLPEQALRDALTLGVQAAAVTVSRPGANPPWSHEL